MNLKKMIFSYFIFVIAIYAQDKPEWLHFDMTNSALPSNAIQAIAVDSNNVKWIGTDKGLVNFDGENWQIFDKDNGLASDNVTAIAIDRNNIVWIYDSLLSCYNGIEWKHYIPPIRYNCTIYSRTIVVDSSNTLWMINTVKLSSHESVDGIMSFKDSIFTLYDWASTGIDLRGVKCLATRKNEIWLGGYSKLLKLVNGNWTNCRWDSLSQNYIRPIINGIDFDSKGTAWIVGHYLRGGIDAGWNEFHLYRIEDDNKYYDVSIPIDIFDGEASAFFIDKNDNKWIGIHWYGLIKLSEEDCQNYTTGNSDILSNHIGSIIEDVYQNKWLASHYRWYHIGINVFRENGVILTTLNNEMVSNSFDYNLSQNFPNPFNPSTNIEFDLSKPSEVTLKIFNILGEEVATLVSDRLTAGSYSYEWDATNFGSGVYLYRLEAGNFVEIKKMILMK